MSSKPNRALILAAGRGSRLGAAKPKCLVHIGRHTLLDHQLVALQRVGVKQVVMVVGHQSAQIEAYARSNYPHLQWEFVHNPLYASSNTLWSLARAVSFLDEATWLLNADVLFGVGVLNRLVQDPRPSALAIEPRACGDEEMKAQLGLGGRLLHLSKRMDPAVCAGEFVGVARFDAVAAKAVSTSLLATASTSRHAYFEHALNHAQVSLYGTLLQGEPVIEVDFPEDLRRAQQEVLPLMEAL